MTEPKTAKAALESWQKSVDYLDDPDSGERLIDTYANAHRTIQLAKIEGLSLDQLVPDEETRKGLESDALAFTVINNGYEEGID